MKQKSAYVTAFVLLEEFFFFPVQDRSQTSKAAKRFHCRFSHVVRPLSYLLSMFSFNRIQTNCRRTVFRLSFRTPQTKLFHSSTIASSVPDPKKNPKRSNSKLRKNFLVFTIVALAAGERTILLANLPVRHYACKFFSFIHHFLFFLFKL